MSPMFIMIYLCAVARVASQSNEVQNFTCEALRTVYQINNCCTQGCTAPPIMTNAPPIMTNEGQKWNITIKDLRERRSGLPLHVPPIELHFGIGWLNGLDPLDIQPLYDMMLEANRNQWLNNSILLFDYDGRYTKTQGIKNKALYGLGWPPGGPPYLNDDIDLLVAAIGVAAKRMEYPNVSSGAEYIQQKILAPLASTAWLAKGQLAAPSDVHDRMAELIIGRPGTFAPELGLDLYTVPRDPNHTYIDGEWVWGSDIPQDGYIMSDRNNFYVTEKTNSTEDYLTGGVDHMAAGTLQDWADLAKLVMRGGMHRKNDGTLVRVLSPEAINYLLKFWNGPHEPGELPEGTWWNSYSPMIVWSASRTNGWGFLDDNADPFMGDHDRLRKGRYVNIAIFGGAFCFDVGTGEYAINSMAQVPPGAGSALYFDRNSCDGVGANQTWAQHRLDQYEGVGVSLLSGRMDDYEFFIFVGMMRKGEVQTRNDLYYRWGGMGYLLGHLAVSAAFVDDKFMYDHELLSKYIPEFEALEAFTPGPQHGLCDPGVPCQRTCLPSFYPDCQFSRLPTREDDASQGAFITVNTGERPQGWDDL